MNPFYRICQFVFTQALLCAAVLALTGCQSFLSAGNPNSEEESPVVGSDLLRVGDMVSVYFSGVSAAPPAVEQRIKSDGTITVPYLGDYQAANKTMGQLEAELHDEFVNKREFYKHLTVIVRTEGRVFYVDGEVINPNRYSYMGDMTVTQAIAVASGFTDFAKRSKVELTRANGTKHVVNYDRAKNNSELDLPVYPNDRIFVHRRFY